ncbi:hypothetical protein CXG81DRAFT_27390 [Caulochytrium protostelioides]|uniref:Uncharacterized protein n=1 Tax=Caulochytrium protostelioides TaxID=1555241 RepID=A0A4P9X4A4_9FUNG|nr:hypothetical protein CXG81DRAFT_27390 [Caulochytrium protostelioides]|eukprot:RKO99882.1 hypothetical protein CXG81DRAFT_27390 [Caulochytrium protostelioides]
MAALLPPVAARPSLTPSPTPAPTAAPSIPLSSLYGDLVRTRERQRLAKAELEQAKDAIAAGTTLAHDGFSGPPDSRRDRRRGSLAGGPFSTRAMRRLVEDAAILDQRVERLEQQMAQVRQLAWHAWPVDDVALEMSALDATMWTQTPLDAAAAPPPATAFQTKLARCSDFHDWLASIWTGFYIDAVHHLPYDLFPVGNERPGTPATSYRRQGRGPHGEETRWHPTDYLLHLAAALIYRHLDLNAGHAVLLALRRGTMYLAMAVARRQPVATWTAVWDPAWASRHAELWAIACADETWRAGLRFAELHADNYMPSPRSVHPDAAAPSAPTGPPASGLMQMLQHHYAPATPSVIPHARPWIQRFADVARFFAQLRTSLAAAAVTTAKDRCAAHPVMDELAELERLAVNETDAALRLALGLPADPRGTPETAAATASRNVLARATPAPFVYSDQLWRLARLVKPYAAAAPSAPGPAWDVRATRPAEAGLRARLDQTAAAHAALTWQPWTQPRQSRSPPLQHWLLTRAWQGPHAALPRQYAAMAHALIGHPRTPFAPPVADHAPLPDVADFARRFTQKVQRHDQQRRQSAGADAVAVAVSALAAPSPHAPPHALSSASASSSSSASATSPSSGPPPPSVQSPTPSAPAPSNAAADAAALDAPRAEPYLGRSASAAPTTASAAAATAAARPPSATGAAERHPSILRRGPASVSGLSLHSQFGISRSANSTPVHGSAGVGHADLPRRGSGISVPANGGGGGGGGGGGASRSQTPTISIAPVSGAHVQFHGPHGHASGATAVAHAKHPHGGKADYAKSPHPLHMRGAAHLFADTETSGSDTDGFAITGTGGAWTNPTLREKREDRDRLTRTMQLEVALPHALTTSDCDADGDTEGDDPDGDDHDDHDDDPVDDVAPADGGPTRRSPPPPHRSGTPHRSEDAAAHRGEQPPGGFASVPHSPPEPSLSTQLIPGAADGVLDGMLDRDDDLVTPLVTRAGPASGAPGGFSSFGGADGVSMTTPLSSFWADDTKDLGLVDSRGTSRATSRVASRAASPHLPAPDARDAEPASAPVPAAATEAAVSAAVAPSSPRRVLLERLPNPSFRDLYDEDEMGSRVSLHHGRGSSTVSAAAAPAGVAVAGPLAAAAPATAATPSPTADPATASPTRDHASSAPRSNDGPSSSLTARGGTTASSTGSAQPLSCVPHGVIALSPAPSSASARVSSAGVHLASAGSAMSPSVTAPSATSVAATTTTTGAAAATATTTAAATATTTATTATTAADGDGHGDDTAGDDDGTTADGGGGRSDTAGDPDRSYVPEGLFTSASSGEDWNAMAREANGEQTPSDGDAESGAVDEREPGPDGATDPPQDTGSGTTSAPPSDR